ncbi:superoxide dismutase [Bisporella sp. PMI_857]|nr:superoxide dismutase [Bisporella sp. PMI_857]
MKFTSLGLALVASLVNAQNAPVVTNNPVGVVYTATFPETPFFKPVGANIKGSVVATANPDGVGVSYDISISNLPSTGGPFIYHLHVNPVPADGNCTKTLAHLDPFARGEATPCNKSDLSSCQPGDLSGKYGNITTTSFSAHYTDLYSSTLPGIGAFFGNRSIVVHFANKTRITCANFTKSSLPIGNGTNTTVPYPTGTAVPPPGEFIGLAAKMGPALPLLAIAGLSLLL